MPDHAADPIIAAARDYAMGYYDRDPRRMERCLHGKLAKRITVRSEGAPDRLSEMSALELVQLCRTDDVYTGERRCDVTVLSNDAQTATVRLDMDGWVDYMHLGVFDGAWKIVNVLWRLTSADEPAPVIPRDVADTIRTRRAVRHFTREAVSDADVLRILDAGRRAPSSKNSQPWDFVVTRDRDRLQALSECGAFAGHLAGAVFAVALVAERAGSWVTFDLGKAAAEMQLAAWSIGIGSCIAALSESERAKSVLGVPAERALDVAISFGRPAAEQPAVELGPRRTLDDVVRWDDWNS